MTQGIADGVTIAPPERVLVIIIAATIALVVISVIFAVGVLYLHVRNERRARDFTERERAWQPVLLDVLVEGASAAARLEVRPEHRPHFLEVLTRFAARLRGDERRLLTQVARPYLAIALDQLHHAKPEVRARAVRALALLGLPEYADAVVEAMDDPSPLVSMTAARGLARREHPEYAGSVLARMDRFEHWNPLFLAAMIAALGAGAAPELRLTLGNRAASAQLRALAANALASLRDLESADLAVEVLRSEPPAELAAACLRLLGSVGRPEHLSVVHGFLEDPSAAVRGEAVDATAATGGREEVRLLEPRLRDTSPWVGLRAARGLHELGARDWLRSVGEGTDVPAALAREVLAERAS